MPRFLNIKTIYVVVCLGCALTLCILAFRNDSMHRLMYANTGYFFMLSLFGIWCLSLYAFAKRESFNLLSWCRQHKTALMLMLLLTGSIFFSVGAGYRVLSDETNLISVSRSMSLDKKVYNTIMGKWYYDNFYAIEEELPTRPILFPFLASLLHSTTGYRYQNVFYLNGILGFLLFAVLYAALIQRFSFSLSLSLILLIASQPLLGLCLTSAGYEIANLLFLLLSCIFAAIYARKQSDESFLALWYTLIMCAHVRYENPIYMVIIAGVLLYMKAIPWSRIVRLAPHAATGALLLVPRYWQALFADGNYENGNAALLDLRRVPERLSQWLGASFDLSFKQPYASLSNMLVVTILVIAGAEFFRYRRQNKDAAHSAFLLSTGLCTASYTLITASHFLANPVHPAVYRLFAIPMVVLTGSAYLGFRYFHNRAHAGIFVAALALFITYNPVAMKREVSKSLTLIRETEEVYNYLDRLNDPHVLIVIDRPGQYTVRNNGAVDYEYANKHPDELLGNLERHLISRILVVQEVNYGSQQAKVPLNEKYALTPTYQFQHDAVTKIVISEATPASVAPKL